MTRPLKIVVADDERDTREYFREYLTRLGHEVRVAEDGQQLVETCRTFGPDLVIADYAMPRLDGLAAAAEINRDRPVPVILMTGHHVAEQMAAPDRTPVIQFLAKPVREAELRTAIAAVATGAEQA